MILILCYHFGENCWNHINCNCNNGKNNSFIFPWSHMSHPKLGLAGRLVMRQGWCEEAPSGRLCQIPVPATPWSRHTTPETETGQVGCHNYIMQTAPNTTTLTWNQANFTVDSMPVDLQIDPIMSK